MSQSNQPTNPGATMNDPAVTAATASPVASTRPTRSSTNAASTTASYATTSASARTSTETEAPSTIDLLTNDDSNPRQQASLWNTHFLSLKSFQAHFGHIRVSRKDKYYGTLGNWVYKQRMAYKRYKRGEEGHVACGTMNERRARLLESIGFSLEFLEGFETKGNGKKGVRRGGKRKESGRKKGGGKIMRRRGGGGGGGVGASGAGAVSGRVTRAMRGGGGVARSASDINDNDDNDEDYVPDGENEPNCRASNTTTKGGGINNNETSAKSSKSDRIDNNIPIEFQFGTGIPEYYKNIPIQDQEHSEGGHYYIGSDSEGSHNGNNDDKEAGKGDHDSNEQARYQLELDEFDPVKDKAKRIQEHKQFTTALEKYGSAAGSHPGTLAWHAMAKELEWTIEEVKVYAYSYFKALMEMREQRSAQIAQSAITEESEKNGNGENVALRAISSATAAATSSPSITSAWSFEEKVLLDSLLLKHGDEFASAASRTRNDTLFDGNSNGRVRGYFVQPSVWHKIAAAMPGKSVDECREMGLLRLNAVKRSCGKQKSSV